MLDLITTQTERPSPMAETKVFEKTAANGMRYEVHESAGFAGHLEIAIMIGGTPVSIIAVDRTRSGLHVKSIESKKMNIAVETADGQSKEDPPKGSPSLNDIAPHR